MVNIEINGKKIEAHDGAMVIEAADEAGIAIPRFCYHKKLSIAANCRMCLVEVEKAAKPQPACATPVTEGMRVFTKSPKAITAQKGVMEFLLINHPLDCPICDQGGECNLQEMAMGYGKDVSRYSESKRVVKDKNIGPLIATEMTRCIHCTRCIRFGQEIGGIMELGATGRGEHMKIGTYVEKAVASELSGNIIDLCPVGALTSRPYRYSARPWELTQNYSVAPHDCVGSNLIVETRRDQVMRVLPHENESINETWISDRDRFSYEAHRSADRLLQPMVKENNVWRETDWETALQRLVAGTREVIEAHGADEFGGLASPCATTEELYLLQRLLRGIGSNNIDHRLRQTDFSMQDAMPAYPCLGQPIAELENIDAALLIGSNLRKEQPILANRLRKASIRNARLMFINPVDYEFTFPVAEMLIESPAGMVPALAGVAKSLLHITGRSAPAELEELLADVESHDAHLAIAEYLRDSANSCVLLGSQACMYPRYANLHALAVLIADIAGARFGTLSDGGNAAGACLAGALPHREAAGHPVAKHGKHAEAMLRERLKGYLLLGIEPEYDTLNPALALNAVEQADFVAVMSAYITDSMRAYADVLLPLALFTETSGTFVNAEGRWQCFQGAVEPPGDVRPGWKVLRVLGNLFGLKGFDYLSSEDVHDELKQQCEGVESISTVTWADLETPEVAGVITRIGFVPLYATDASVRRALPLQGTIDAQIAMAVMNSATARQCGVSSDDEITLVQEGNRVVLPLVVDEGIADDCVIVPTALDVTRTLGACFGTVEIARG